MTAVQALVAHLRLPISLRLAVALILAGLLNPAPGQRYGFSLYGHRDGLTNLSVETILQDRQGFLWVGTDNGLFCYDGQQFRPYGPAEGLDGRITVTLAESEDGTLWVATRNGLFRSLGSRFVRVAEARRRAVLSVISDPEGHVYATTEDGPLTLSLDSSGSWQAK